MTGKPQDLHEFLKEYRRDHPADVCVVDDAVDRDQEATAIVFELAEQGRQPMLWLKNVIGVDCAVVTNVFASRARIARILGVSLPDLHRSFQHGVDRRVPPRLVDAGPITEIVEEGTDVDVRSVPALKHFEGDRGAYINSGIVVARMPDTGSSNLSYHRATADGKTRLATSLHSRGHLWRALQMAKERDEPLPVAMVIGGHPLFMLAAASRVSVEIDEREIAGGLLGAPLEIVRTPRYGLGVPASADFVLEGSIDATAHAEEGPYGEFSGYSSLRSTNNVIEVEALMRRRDPVLLDVVSGPAPDHLNLGRIPREADMQARILERFPDVIDLHYATSGTHFHCYVSLRSRMPGHARQVILALLGWDPYLKLVIAVDDDIDISRDEDVLWAIATRFQADRDIILATGLPGSLLDPSSEAIGTTSRMGLDATKGQGFCATRVEIAETATIRARQLLERLPE